MSQPDSLLPQKVAKITRFEKLVTCNDISKLLVNKMFQNKRMVKAYTEHSLCKDELIADWSITVKRISTILQKREVELYMHPERVPAPVEKIFMQFILVMLDNLFRGETLLIQSDIFSKQEYTELQNHMQGILYQNRLHLLR